LRLAAVDAAVPVLDRGEVKHGEQDVLHAGASVSWMPGLRSIAQPGIERENR
jgi:hypothetical protein